MKYLLNFIVIEIKKYWFYAEFVHMNSKQSAVGIEGIGFNTTNYCFDLSDLAQQNNQQSEKYIIGLGQQQMSVVGENDSIITMAKMAYVDCIEGIINGYKAKNVNVSKEDIENDIDLLLFATESAIDASKASAVELHERLNLKKSCRCLEIKHACYGGTGALWLAKMHVLSNPDSKVLVIASDIAWYGFNTSGEATQGCGAVAMLVSLTPTICTFNNDNITITQCANDFYRPISSKTPVYDGHYSVKCYLQMFKQSINQYTEKNGKIDFDKTILISHMPFAKMLNKCCGLLGIDDAKNRNSDIQNYVKHVGNTYTSSLYLGLISLLDNCKDDIKGSRILMYSYGSGAECELYSINILEGYSLFLNKENRISMINNRKKLTYSEYCSLWQKYNDSI